MRAWIDAPNRKQVHLLFGDPGSGTSTVLYNAAHYEELGIRAASDTGVGSFGFQTLDASQVPDRTHDFMVTFIATVVCQLVRTIPKMKSWVAIAARSLREESAWRNASLDDLVDTLLITPHRHASLKNSKPFPTFILLDDIHHLSCHTRDFLLDIMAQTIDSKMPIYFMIAASGVPGSLFKESLLERKALRCTLEENSVKSWPGRRNDRTPGWTSPDATPSRRVGRVEDGVSGHDRTLTQHSGDGQRSRSRPSGFDVSRISAQSS